MTSSFFVSLLTSQGHAKREELERALGVFLTLNCRQLEKEFVCKETRAHEIYIELKSFRGRFQLALEGSLISPSTFAKFFSIEQNSTTDPELEISQLCRITEGKEMDSLSYAEARCAGEVDCSLASVMHSFSY